MRVPICLNTATDQPVMALGIIMAAVTGLSMPVWLLLLAQSLAVFKQIGTLIVTGGSVDVLLDDMYKLVCSFAYVDVISLSSDTVYANLWIYVGNVQMLQIHRKCMAAALK